MRPLKISADSMVNALGYGKQATFQALKNGTSGLRLVDDSQVCFDTWVGRVNDLVGQPLVGEYQQYDCRNNRLAKICLDTEGFSDYVLEARSRYGSRRIGVILGTSTSGITSTEQAYLHRNRQSGDLPESFDLLNTHNIHSLVKFCQQYLQLDGPGMTISTACSSSAKVFAAASRYIESGLCDAVVVGGVDSLCLTTLYGFHSLQLVSMKPCKPWDSERSGISIGEAAGFALLESADDSSDIVFKGYGESSDAFHMSSPHPEGYGASLAMRRALELAKLNENNLDYINLHGTATPSNDEAEDKAILNVFGSQIFCSSTKGFTGHTLGAAGITEALISMIVLNNELLPANLNLRNKDSSLAANVLFENVSMPVNNVMSNSFGFGGSNCCLIFGK